ncbi:MAG: acyl-CoA dehydrogenase family protein [Firmicutes bacterium]|nr:acyl-CoA dehydrogenase family protein [Alicyclobacillaceae bacterium]MCL6497731.1 acyl-CoA dehydrogenase family protein [Bacillota bacterium]
MSGLSLEEQAARRTIRWLVAESSAVQSASFANDAAALRRQLEWWGEKGYHGLVVPPEWGGRGRTFLLQTLVVEALAERDAALALLYEVHNALHLEAVWRYGSDAQRAAWLPDLIAGRRLGGFALTEEEAGSDAEAIACRAVPEAGGWRLFGHKRFVTGGGLYDQYLVFARVPGAGPTAFVVERDQAGVTFGPPHATLGLESVPVADLQLDGVLVADTARLGAEGAGYAMALDLLDGGRVGVAAQAVGILAAALRQSLAFARQRRQFGRPIAGFQGVQWKLAEMARDLAAARLLTYEAARRRPLGESERPLFAMAKWFASERAVYHAAQAVQIHGGRGYLREMGVERLYRDSKATEIYEGTSEILRLVIASRLINGYNWDSI